MKPAIGQIVIHRDRELFERPAIITQVRPDQSVNLQVFLDATRVEKLLSEGPNTMAETCVPSEKSKNEILGNCWRFRYEQRELESSCDCCGAPWVDSGDLQGLPCNCLLNRYCSTCMYCEEHCECGQDQDLQADFLDAALVRLDRMAAKEELPEILGGS